MTASTAQNSIYAHVAGTTPATQSTRCSRRARAKARVVPVEGPWPVIRVDRATPLRRAAQASAEHGLEAFCASLAAEVTQLEDWAASRPRRSQTDGATIRRALEFLRRFGRLSAMDFSDVPVEDRASLIRILALEHRWCYAAAGTTRSAFKTATGRTGAR